MKTVAFLVTLKIQTGEYEKTTHTLVKHAVTEESAATQALLAECHCNLDDGAEWLEKGQQIEDLHGEMIYTLYDCKPVTEQELPTLEKFF